MTLQASKKRVALNTYEGKGDLARLSKGLALNAYEGKGDFTHLTDGTTLNAYGFECL